MHRLPLNRNLRNQSPNLITGIAWQILNESIQCFEENMRLLVTVPVWIMSFRITDSTFWKLGLGLINTNFYWKMLSEQVSNIHFCSDQLRGKKKHWSKSR